MAEAASSESSTTSVVKREPSGSENTVVEPLGSGPYSNQGSDRYPNKTQAFRERGSGLNQNQLRLNKQNSYSGKTKQVYRRKGRAEAEKDHWEKGKGNSHSELMKGTTEEPFCLEDHGKVTRKRDELSEHTSGADTRKGKQPQKIPEKFPGKYRARKGNYGNLHMPGAPGAQPGRNRKSKREIGLNGKGSEDVNAGIKFVELPKSLMASNQQKSLRNHDTSLVSHGIVSDGVYRRKDKGNFNSNSAYKSSGQKKQEENRIESKKVTEPSGYVKKSPEASTFMFKVSANENQRIFNKTSQSSMQASVLIEQLTDEKYECMVCCDVVRCSKAVWSCLKCYHIFHLFCIKRWANSPAAAACDGECNGWRCPACQYIECKMPNVYTCFCGKVEEPKWYPQDGITPHSCGELCLKERTGKHCPHPCNQLCHPGPCPTCPVTITKKCCCGTTTSPVRCGKTAEITCISVCGKLLNCGIHMCKDNCHLGGCKKCDVVTEQYCYCGKKAKDAVCGTGTPTFIGDKPGYFSCDTICSKKLECGNHECDQICHPSECNSCTLQPSVITHCPCGKKKVTELLDGSNRISCLDPVPICGNPCDRLLPCAKFNDMTKTTSDHRCKKLCHHGDCSSCISESIVKCRCRAISKKMPCAELNVTGEPYLCELKCNKLKDCLKHRCNEKCCVGRRKVTIRHPCNFICAKRLKCGIHRCTEVCHIFKGCPPCLMAGFEERFCPCGGTVQEPPIPCGAPPPTCYRPCSRTHPCQHEVQHTCHYEEECPPCTVLVSKWCMGEHKLRDNIPCYVDSVSCGEECRKILCCGKHTCRRMCHKSPCLEDDEECKQLCVAVRESCGHPCDAPCHEGECPQIPCKSKIRIYCKCGRKSEDSVCLKGGDVMEATQAYQRFTTKNLAEKMKGLQDGQSVDISGLMGLKEKKEQLDCDEGCAIKERNRVLAGALGMTQTDVTNRNEAVQFPYFLEEHGKTNMKFLYFVENALENLVKAVLKVQSPTLTHSFAAMNTKNRRFVHELATLYGCTSMSYDQEPNRNTVVTATKSSRSPRGKLSSHIQRQINPQPPPPIPILPDQGIGDARFIQRKPQERNVVDYFEDDF